VTTASKSKYLPIPRLPFPRVDSIRNRILVFAVMATLLPSGVTLWISYLQNRAALEAKIAQALVAQSEQTSREMAVWIKERLYDLRVFAGSDEVSGNLARVAKGAAASPTRGRLHDYLGSLHERFSDFEQLLVLDRDGRVVGTSARAAGPVRLPEGWLKTLRTEGQLVGDVYWDEAARAGKLIIAVPVQRPDGAIIGAFAAELNLRPVQQVLRTFAPDSTSAVYLLSAEGAVLASSREISGRLLTTTLHRVTLRRLMRSDRDAVSYIGFAGKEVVGILKPVPLVRWVVLAEIPSDLAFRQVREFGNFALLVVAVLLLVATESAYRFGRIIVRPLDRLAMGAAEVAAGDLAVDLPVAGGGEVGYLTSVFNHMVSRLRESRQQLDATNETLRRQNEELERLSLTDSLTGLSNRRFLMQRLNEEALRYRRTRHDVAVLMLDVDHFKKYNDTYGHPAGDEVLKKVARILQVTAREVDCVARYGGEEFCLMLPETSVAGALKLAERIRTRMAAEQLPGENVTLSIGVASLPGDGETPDDVIAAADEALYRAKREGRDRVVQAGQPKKKGEGATTAG
jgi:diguanylate cyclase (GGDEF)-like protein